MSVLGNDENEERRALEAWFAERFCGFKWAKKGECCIIIPPDEEIMELANRGAALWSFGKARLKFHDWDRYLPRFFTSRNAALDGIEALNQEPEPSFDVEVTYFAYPHQVIIKLEERGINGGGDTLQDALYELAMKLRAQGNANAEA